MLRDRQPPAALLNTARHLTSQLARIEAMHRAGIEPTFGDLQDLFTTSTMLARQLDVPSHHTEAALCPVDGCLHQAVTEILPGRAVCLAHARLFRTLAGAKG